MQIDIVRWNESSQILISNALKPAEVAEVSLCFELGRATVIVNDDQLSLAIGKRGQNVRLAARLTGWDIDILTPPEFQNGVARLDQTLKGMGIAQEQVDKAIALGLIDVRDIEETGTGPLMEELGLEEGLAEQVVAKCGIEAKLVAAEQEAKKSAEAKKKAADRAAFEGGVRSASAGPSTNPLLAGTIENKTSDTTEDKTSDTTETEIAAADHVPDGMEHSAGGSPETTVHDEKSFANTDELSPEELAVHGVEEGGEAEELSNEDADGTAALAEGRSRPPV